MKSLQKSSFLALTTVLILLFFANGLALASTPPAFSSLGQLKADNLELPGAMDLDDNGNLYVADIRGGLVHKFDTYGVLLQSYDLQSSGRGLAVDPSGSLLYASRGDSVVIFDLALGQVIGELADADEGTPDFVSAGHVDLDSNGNVFVADTSSLEIRVYDPSGSFLTSFGEAGVGTGQFDRIGGMAVNPSDQVVVADASATNGQVHVFTLNELLNVSSVISYAKDSAINFGSPIMFSPRGIAFDSLGRGYFLEFISTQIRVVSAEFNYLGAYTEVGYEEGQLNNVIDVVYDDVNDRLFVGCDTARIEILGVDNGSNPDPDGDGVTIGDNCLFVANPDQLDSDADGFGDACDACPSDPSDWMDNDGDSICESNDNCPNIANLDQRDANNNGLGDACDAFDSDGDGVSDADEYVAGTDPERIGVLLPGYVFPAHIAPLELGPEGSPVDGQRPLPK